MRNGVSRCPRTHRNPCVLVQDDLKQMWGEDGWRFETFFWFGDVGLLVVRSRRGTGQLCWETVTGHLKIEVLGVVSFYLRCCHLAFLVFGSLDTDLYSLKDTQPPKAKSTGNEKTLLESG